MRRRRVAAGIAAAGLLTAVGAVCEVLLRDGKLQRDIQQAWDDYERSLDEVQRAATRVEEMRAAVGSSES